MLKKTFNDVLVA